MAGFEVLGPFIAAVLMGLGALCIFVWGVLSGAFFGADEASVRFFLRETGDDRTGDQ